MTKTGKSISNIKLLLLSLLLTLNIFQYMTQTFLDQRGDYRSLKAFRKAECIYDITYFFAHKFLKIGDRTIDQMIQAARFQENRILLKDI